MGSIVVSEFMAPSALELLSADHDVTHDPGLAERRDDLLAAVAAADALVVRNRTSVDAALLAAAPRLAVVGRLGVGLDNIDVAACEAQGVVVRTAAGANAVAVAEYVIGALLGLARPALRGSERVLAGEWPRTESVGIELSGRVLGLLGLGATAREVARRAGALGMTVMAYDPYVDHPPPGVQLSALTPLFATADAVSVHVPLVPATTGLVGGELLQHARAGLLLVDASRGGVVDHPAVVAALKSGRLGGAALDVFPDEPPTDLARYRGAPNLILTPHVAGVTAESNDRVGSVVAAAVLEVIDGR